MATVNLVLWTHRPDAEGRYPVTVRVSHLGHNTYYTTKIRLLEEDWVRAKMFLSGSYSKDMGVLAQKLWIMLKDYKEALDIVSRERDVSKMTSQQLKDELVRRVEGRAPRVSATRSFLAVYDAFAASRETEGTRNVYASTRSKMLDYDPSVSRMSLDDVTLSWLEGFDASMRGKVTSATRYFHMKNLKAVMNHAWKNEYVSKYVFVNFKMPKPEQTSPRALTLEQVRALLTCPCGPFEKEYRDLFMLSLYLIGINGVDLLKAKKSDVVNGRLEYRRQKTHRLYSIKIEPEAMAILKRYAGKDWLLSPLDRYSNYKDYLHHWDDGLGRVGMTGGKGKRREGEPLFPDLTTYWARHTWATIASGLDIPVEVIGRALGHSSAKGGVTAIYINFDTRKIDEANRRVIDCILGK